MKVKFRLYTGEAGDLQTLLIGESETGHIESVLIPRTGFSWYRLYRMRAAKKSIIKKLELVTGKKHHEE